MGWDPEESGGAGSRGRAAILGGGWAHAPGSAGASSGQEGEPALCLGQPALPPKVPRALGSPAREGAAFLPPIPRLPQ